MRADIGAGLKPSKRSAGRRGGLLVTAGLAFASASQAAGRPGQPAQMLWPAERPGPGALLAGGGAECRLTNSQ